MGTGWLISPTIVVTAGHVVFDRGNKLGQANQIKCYIGYHGHDSVPSAGNYVVYSLIFVSDVRILLANASMSVQARYGKTVVTTGAWVSTGPVTKDVAFIQAGLNSDGAPVDLVKLVQG